VIVALDGNDRISSRGDRPHGGNQGADFLHRYVAAKLPERAKRRVLNHGQEGCSALPSNRCSHPCPGPDQTSWTCWWVPIGARVSRLGEKKVRHTEENLVVKPCLLEDLSERSSNDRRGLADSSGPGRFGFRPSELVCNTI
jgi:hypothetical protein